MICKLCNEDKLEDQFPHPKNEKNPRTTCYKCINGIARLKYKKEGRKRNRTPRKKVIKEKKDRFNPKPTHAIKLYKIERCSYVLCNCVIEEGQPRVYHQYPDKTKSKAYCSKWCKEVAEIDKRLGLNTYEVQKGDIYSSA